MTTVLIEVDGVDVTDIVRYADALFISQVNGTPGLCQFAVRDLGHDQAFVFGQTITLDLDGDRRWTGYVEKVQRQYSAEVVDTTAPPQVARWFLIQGFDINILFSRRVVHDGNKLTATTPDPAHDDPAHADQWLAGTHSDDIISWVIENHTEMFADGVTLGGVEDLGSPNPDLAGAFAAGQTVGDFMRSVNRLLGGIWYLKPDFEMVHRFIEVATTDYYLSDHDGYGGTDPYFVGARDYSFVSDGSEMVNDALVWGTAAGVVGVKFAREEDATSIAQHGRWQYGEFNTAMYKQASLNHRAEALVYGNDASRHGAKDDRLVVTATVFEPVFFLGDVVYCESQVFASSGQVLPFEPYSNLVAILPVRRITMTFPTPTDVQYDLMLSQELDEPWNIFEYRFPRLKPIGWGGWPEPNWEWPPVGEPGCIDEICAQSVVFDDFNRTVASSSGGGSPGFGWGVPSIGSSYWFTDGSSADVSVNGTQGVVDVSSSSEYLDALFQGSSGLGADIHFRDAFTMRVDFTPGVAVPANSSAQVTFRVNGITYSGQTRRVNLYWSTWAGDPSYLRVLDASGQTDYTLPGNPTSGEVVHLVWDFTPNGLNQAKVWYGSDPEPSAYQVSQTSLVLNPGQWSNFYIGTGQEHASTWLFDELSFDYGLCNDALFENFAPRSVSGGWGYPTQGGPEWANGSGLAAAAVSTGYGVLPLNTGTSTNALMTYHPDSGSVFAAPFRDAFTCTASFRFNTAPTGSQDLTFSFRIQQMSGPFTPVSGSERRLDLRVEAGASTFGVGMTGDLDTISIADPPPNTQIFVKWEYSATVARGKVWWGSAEPSAWMSEELIAGVTGGWTRLIAQASSDYNVTASFGPIDFFYDGRTCYQDCTGQVTIVDQFSRTVNPGWGTATSGHAWNNSPSTGLNTTGASRGNMVMPTSGASLQNRIDVTSNGLGFSFAARINGSRAFVDSGVAGVFNGDFAAIFFTSGGVGTYDVIIGGSRLGVDADGGTASPLHGVTTGSAQFEVAGEWNGPGTDFNVWIWQSGARPSTPKAVISAVMSFPVDQIRVYAIRAGSALTVSWDNIFFQNRCVPGAPPSEGSAGLPLTGFVCETIEHSGGTDFSATRAFKGEPEIYVNNFRVLPGPSHAAFSYDAAAGTIELASSISGSDMLRLCYEANGVPS